jgi:serine/threonine-protein kinase RsbW
LGVRDAGVAHDMTPVDFDDHSLSGRGLSIINRVADRWWVDMSAGTQVNAELCLTPQ